MLDEFVVPMGLCKFFIESSRSITEKPFHAGQTAFIGSTKQWRALQFHSVSIKAPGPRNPV
jgi:hypothetical protein